MGMGAILRDSTGQMLIGFSKCFFGCFSSNIAEAICLREALSWLKAGGFGKVIVESDAKAVVDAVNGSFSDISEFGNLIGNCRRLVLENPNVRISYVRRQANGVAHALAKAAHYYASPSLWQQVPSFLRDLLLSDVLNF